MESKTQAFFVELEAKRDRTPRSFQLYEEFNHKTIAEILRSRTRDYSKLTSREKLDLEYNIERELESFKTWLENNKNLDPNSAYYCSISLKSMLLGLPVGAQIAQLFDSLIEKANFQKK